MILWRQTVSAHAARTRPPRRLAPDQRRALTRPESRRSGEAEPTGETLTGAVPELAWWPVAFAEALPRAAPAGAGAVDLGSHSRMA